MGEDRMVRLLELDLEYLHRTIDKFDNQRFSIRSWAVTTGGALLALAVSVRNAGVPIVGLFVVAFFAYLEIVYMDMQVRVMRRCTRVGQLLHSSVSNPSTWALRRLCLRHQGGIREGPVSVGQRAEHPHDQA